MSSLYLACLLPIAIGTIIFVISHEVNWIEWLIGTVVCFLTAGIVNYISFNAQTKDFEIWSGKIVSAKQFSAWREYYEYAVYKDESYWTTESYTDSNGKRKSRRVRKTRKVFSHWQPTSRWHSESHTAYSTLGDSFSISKDKFNYFVRTFGNQNTVPGDRRTSEHNSRMISGDPNDYTTSSPPDIIEPIHVSRPVVNRLLASRSVFNFAEVSPDIKQKLFAHPEVNDPFRSNRVLGVATKGISYRQWDILNAKLGASKGVNLIICGWDDSDRMLGEWQRSLWNGGKKNDLVLCYGPKWAKVFGWSDSDILKKDLESLLLSESINNDLLPKIEELVANNYEKTDWHKFDHLQVEPSGKSWFWFWFVMILTQGGLYFFFHKNQFSK